MAVKRPSDHSLLMSLLQTWLVPAACLFAIGGIWIADLIAGADLRFGFLYILPLGACAWWGTRRAAVACAAAASMALVANDLALRASPTLLATLWNEFTRVTTFFAIALLISSVRHSSELLRNESARAFRLAVTDPLTGLYNRHYLNEQLERIHPAAARHHRPYALLALDLDGFKQINDTAGHAAGDAALVAFALGLRSVVRGDDIVVRTGGDEFIVLLPVASVGDAVALAGRLQTAVRASGGDNLVRGLSAGAVAWAPYSTPAGLLAEADRLVYESKRVGGGRVSVSGRDKTT
jgi:diguanylate cyclase (GGDEF)-like protein